jgi:hypothetical protein
VRSQRDSNQFKTVNSMKKNPTAMESYAAPKVNELIIDMTVSVLQGSSGETPGDEDPE